MRLIGSQKGGAVERRKRARVRLDCARMQAGRGVTHLKQKSPNSSSSPSSCTSCTAAAAMSTFHAAVCSKAQSRRFDCCSCSLRAPPVLIPSIRWDRPLK